MIHNTFNEKNYPRALSFEEIKTFLMAGHETTGTFACRYSIKLSKKWPIRGSSDVRLTLLMIFFSCDPQEYGCRGHFYALSKHPDIQLSRYHETCFQSRC